MASTLLDCDSTRPLSLHIDTPPSASPFPSPSSSFLPPPMPGAHEFAVKPPPRRKSSAFNSTEINSPTTPKQLPSTNGHGHTQHQQHHPPGPPAADQSSSDPPLQSQADYPSDILSPTTPTPASIHNNHFISAAGTVPSSLISSSSSPDSSQQMQDPVATPNPDPIANTRPPLSPVLTNSPSLSPTRPAPPSPADSRRISTISLRSSGSKPPSAAVSRSNSQRRSIGIGLTISSSTPNSKRQSQLSALSTGSNPTHSPQLTSFGGLKEADESIAAALTAAAATTPTVAAMAAATMTSPATTNTTTTGSAAKSKTRKRSTRVKIKIRDFAFAIPDDRYRGMGVDVPKPNRFSRLNKKLGGSRKVRPTSKRWSTASSTNASRGNSDNDNNKDDDDDDDDDNDDDDEEGESEGWFRRGMGRFSWSFGFGGLRKQQQQFSQQEEEEEEMDEQEEPYPSRGDLERNFLEEDEHGENDDASGQSSEVYYDAEDDLDGRRAAEGEGQNGEEGEEEEPLYPGLYRAMFAFEPEGTAEMRLVEDQVVRIVGRGGGVGWAVAVVPEDAEGGVLVEGGVRHALVPESYLEVVELD